jgi:2-polyprenyl-6-methoxyphenol hydroxylase-like FAD-dependent oxidoreductase
LTSRPLGLEPSTVPERPQIDSEEITEMTGRVGERAVILGGSITALFVASALAEAYHEVILVDRDRLTGVREARRGAPQARHINGLLARGAQALEELFPDITIEIVKEEQAPLTDLSGTVRWYFNGQRLEQARGGLTCVGATRPILEFHCRRRIAALPNVRFMEEYDIVGLTTSADQQRVTGVRVRNRAEDAGQAEVVLSADLVVDATGRGSRAATWLESWGFPRVEETSTKVGLGYASRHYRLRSDPFGKDHSINPVASPALPRGAIFTKTDNGLAELTVYGILGDHPPVDVEGFNAFVRTLAAPEIYDAIIDAEPVNDPVLFRFPTTMWRRYDLLASMPGNLLIVGDAVCTPNPVYAQAQTLAALEALALRRFLRQGVQPEPLDFQRAVAAIVKPAWEMTTTVDLSFPGVEGVRTWQVKLQHAYMKRLQIAATRDGSITAAFMRSAGLMDPPEALMRPGLVLKVLKLSMPVPAGKP